VAHAEQGLEGALDDGGGIAAGDLVGQEILQLAELVVGLWLVASVTRLVNNPEWLAGSPA
jgi:hypothetical protein